MRAYSTAVKGIDADAVNSSAIAGKTLAELSNTLPDTGGLVAFFTGDNSRSFGDQLVPFGEAMKAYSDSVAGLNFEAVMASAIAAQSLVQLRTFPPQCRRGRDILHRRK